MPIDNQELVQKAIVTTDALASYGKLNPAQSDKFIDYVIDVTGLKNNARVVRFRNEEMYLEKIGVGSRVAVPAEEAVSPSVRRGINTSRVTLTPKEIIVPFEIGDTFREINVEGESVEDHIIKMMATQLANDMETLYIEGDTVGRADLESNLKEGGSASLYIKDSLLALFNGWLRKADSGHIVDAANQNIGSNLFSRAINAMPAKYKRNRADLRFFTSLDLEQQYRERVSSRATAAGDQALSATQNLTPFGTPLLPYPLFPYQYREVETVQLNGTTAVALRRAPVASETVLPSTLDQAPTAAYIEGTDYNMDYAAGTIARDSGGSIGDGDYVKVTYAANPTVLLTHMNNLIIAIGRDIRIEKDRDIYKRVNQYAITARIDIQYEEVDALVKLVNIGTGV